MIANPLPLTAPVPARVLKLREAAQTLGVSERQLDGLRRRGAIRTVRLGVRRVGVPVREVERFIDAGGVAAA